MSIKSTQNISREAAIRRIQYINDLFVSKEYEQIEHASFESDYDTFECVNNDKLLSALKNGQIID